MTSTVLDRDTITPLTLDQVRQRVKVLSPKQLQSIRESNARVNVWVGAIRSGKTVASLLRWLIYVAAAPRGGELVITGRTRDSIFRNVISPLQDAKLFSSRITKAVIYTNGASTATILGRRVHIIGASDAKAELIIRGLTVAGWYGDEVTVHPELFVTQMLGRMSVPGAQAFVTTNPEGPRHWFKVKFLDKILLLGWRTWKFQLDDNPSLLESYKASLKREFTGVWYRRFILGEWTAAEGAIYDMWDESRHVVPWASLPRITRLLGVGIDYGTRNAFDAIVLGLGEVDTLDAQGRPAKLGRLYLVDEYRHKSGDGVARWTDAQLSGGLRRFMAEQHTPNPTLDPMIEWVIVDPSAASFRTQLQHDGVHNVAEALNTVLPGIRTVASLLATGNMQVTDRCRHWRDEAPGYTWNIKASADGSDQPNKDNDHSMDAGRYAVHTTASLWRPFIDMKVAA